MKKTAIIWIVVIVVIIIIIGLIAWMSGGNSAISTSTIPVTSTSVTTTTTVPPTSTTVTASNSPVLGIGTSTNLGSYLIASNGMTLYTDTKDLAKESTCYGSCATEWPPYLVGSTTLSLPNGSPLLTGAISTITRTDGTIQVTYRDKALYFWQGDKKQGDTTGSSIGTFLIAQP